MSKVNRIQQALSELDGGAFRKLADAYLVAKGFGPINSIGSVIAANKVRKGTPDTLIALPGGRYLFAEHTTRQSGLLDKIKGDLDKCLDPDKTGIPVEKIQGVIFCFTGKLDAKAQYELTEICQEKGVGLDLFGIDALSFDLYHHYPHLAHDFLDVLIDTGQIVPPDQFVSLYNHNKLATRLDLGFHFREEELDRLLAALEGERLAILSGKAGVGKSRLALEMCRRFRVAHPEYEVLCVFGRNRDLWEDLKSQFSRAGRFLILVDDANRVSRFDYVVDLLLHQREDQRIKVVATVRDYALLKVQEAAQPLGGGEEVALEPFTDDQIKTLLTDECEIHNYHYLDRIADIARGNPRLAVMAAEVAREEESLGSIRDVSALYDRYFSSIREDLRKEGTDLKRADLLKTAAIVSFFKAVDRANEEMMDIIETVFAIPPADFWAAAERLHELEILDMHEDEVVKISDQVLATYLFYLAVFKEKVLDFGIFLDYLFPRFRQRLIDSINPVLDAFDSQGIIKAMRPHVARVWSRLEKDGNDEVFLRFLDAFWFTRRTETLLWVRDRIDGLAAEPVEIAAIVFKPGFDSKLLSPPSLLSILKPFAFTEEGEARMALDLLMRYLAKRPGEVPRVLGILIDNYGFRPDSNRRSFEIQRAVVDTVWDCAKDGDPFFSRVFLAVAGDYLGTCFFHRRINRGIKGARTLELTHADFDLSATLGLTALRQAIWERVFSLYKNEALQKDVLALINDYSASPTESTSSKVTFYTHIPKIDAPQWEAKLAIRENKGVTETQSHSVTELPCSTQEGAKRLRGEVVKSDTGHVLPFLTSALDPDNYRHCVILHGYLDLLKRHDVKVPAGLRKRFSNETHTLAKLLLTEHEPDLSSDEFEQYKRECLARHTADYTLDDYARFFERYLEIREVQAEEVPNPYQLWESVENTLLALADHDPDLYRQVLGLYLERQDPLVLPGYALVRKLLEQRGYDGTRQFPERMDYPARRRWLFHLHEALPDDAVNRERLGHLCELYREAEPADLPYNGINYLLKYLPLDARIVAKVVGMVLKKAEEESDAIYALTLSLFNPEMEITKRLPELFAGDIELLKRAYLVMEGTRNHQNYSGMGTADYNGAVFDRILDLDPAFITEYIAWKYGNPKHGRLMSLDDDRDYAFLWARSDYRQVMDRVIESIREHEQNRLIPISPYLGTFFGNKQDRGASSGEARERQDTYLLGLIDQRSGDVEFMRHLFGVILEFPHERRALFVEGFVARNQSFDAFERLPLGPKPRSGGGSKVPSVQKDLDYWESLLPIMNTVELLPHRQYVEDRIRCLRGKIEREKKKDFMGRF
uniref:Uncharacterized protein n=1 Tax=Candidatus Kentrum eta TaxID=2126337 RepID=A0A450UFB4_9GAMM|nr:MAG: hypothetical protein BECKH772A_GA0070896_100135 [Candidatus Kentron sp. H]VFJ91240.1 MAG: hypothetical protein BECKH772B_GA0070898_1001521 [Candidatus Kentron sp. H]VFJ97681.1 MAG: hypothetical protein BECKH772C_GA0070978_100154 [Candidatus Kentron sp. H]